MRTKKAMRIVLSNIICQVTVALCGLILPRFILHEYGSGINGLTNSIRQILTYMTIVGSGIGLSAMSSLYAPIANKDTDKVNSILSAARMFFNKAGLIFSAGSVALVVIYPFIINGQADMMNAALLVLINATGTMIEFFVANKYRVFLTANQQYNVISTITTQGYILNTIASVVLIKMHASILVVQAVSMAIYVARMVSIASYTKKRYPLLNFHTEPDHAALGQRWSAFYYEISYMIILYSPILIITIFSGLKEVSVFSVYNMVYAAINMLILTFASGLPAGFGEIIASGDTKKLNHTFKSFETAYYIMSFVCYTCFAVLIQSFVGVYTNGIKDVQYVRLPLAIAFVVAGISRSIRSPHVMLVEAAGHFKQNHKLNLTEAGVNLILSIVFVQLWGIAGVVVAIAVSAFMRSVLYIIYSSNKLLLRGLLPTAKKLLGNLFAAALSALPFFVWFPITAHGFAQWFLHAAIVGAWTLFVFIVVNVLLDRPAMHDLWSRIYGLIRRKKAV